MEFICQFIQLDRKLRVVDGFSNTIVVEKTDDYEEMVAEALVKAQEILRQLNGHWFFRLGKM